MTKHGGRVCLLVVAVLVALTFSASQAWASPFKIDLNDGAGPSPTEPGWVGVHGSNRHDKRRIYALHAALTPPGRAFWSNK